MVIYIDAFIQNEYFQSLLIILGTLLFAKIFYYVLNKYVKKFTEETITDIDDMLLKILKRPIHALIILIGSYFSLKSLSLLVSYIIWINGLFFVTACLIIALSISNVVSFFVNRWFKVHERFEKTPKLFSKVVSIIVYLIAFLMILYYFNVEITPLIATLGLGGLAIGLALQATFSNFFAGLHIISDRPINVGDFIELPDTNISGSVEDINWRSTRIRTLPNQLVVIPNSKLAESIIINDSLPEQEMAVLVQVGVSYESNLQKVETITVDVAKKIQKTVAGAIKNFEPFIRYNSFGDSNINFTVILRAEKFVDKFLIIHEFIKALKERYDKEAIEISWPVRKIYHTFTPP